MSQFLIKFVLFALFVAVLGNGEPRVKIGIKKRVEDCTAKTRKGDFVHVHYKVGIMK